MKKLVFAVMAMALAMSAKALSWGSVPVQTDLTSALGSAKSQSKMLFVLLGTDSCHYCLELKNFLASVSSRINKDYVVYYCNGAVDKSMFKAGGYPRWGVFNPFNFVPSKKWDNSASMLASSLGWYGTDAAATVLKKAESAWASASKTEVPTGGDDPVIKPVEKDLSLAFYVDEEFPMEFEKYGTVIEDLLPTAERPESVTLTTKMKMTTEKGAKVTWTKKTQTWKAESGKTNLSSLKLTFNKKKNTFKGTFRLYAITSKGTMKKVTVKIVDGYYANGVGEATATITRVGSWPVRLEAIEE